MADTVLAVASFTLVGLGVAAVASCPTGMAEFGCFAEPVGWGAVLIGAVTGVLFTTSAVVGYNRTSACRASLPPAPPPPPEPPGPPKSLLKHGSATSCERVGDAPRLCPSVSLLDPGGVPLAAPH